MTLVFKSPMPDVQTQIDAAYKRGRDDAAEALTVVKALENGLTLHMNANVSPDYFVKLKDASAVARGGEQA